MIGVQRTIFFVKAVCISKFRTLSMFPRFFAKMNPFTCKKVLALEILLDNENGRAKELMCDPVYVAR